MNLPPLPDSDWTPGATLCYSADQMRAYAEGYADAAVAIERARFIPLMQAVEWILSDGHMNQEHLARLRAAWEAM